MIKEIIKEVCILGAGPGGIATSMFLAQKGIKSLVVDKARFPRDKICGDALSGKVVEVLKKLDHSIVDRLDLAPIQLDSWGVTFVAPNLKRLKVPFADSSGINGQAPGYISKRIDFDHFLLNEARSYEEINILEGIELDSFQHDGKHWIARSRDGKVSVTTKLLIAADGAQSKFARNIGNIQMEPENYCAGVRAYYSGISDFEDNNYIELYFLKELLPGYFWIFPLPDGKANVGIGMRSDVISKKRINLKETLNEVIQRYPGIKKGLKTAGWKAV